MSNYTVTGLIPFNVPRRDNGGYLTLGSLPAWGGEVVTCLNHWRDNGVILKHAAYWKATPAGIEVLHRLDDSISYERAILEQVRRGRMGFSYGVGDNPELNRWVGEWVTAWGRAISTLDSSAPFRKVQPIGVLGHIGHMSYGDISEVAFPQEPIQIAG